jgi:hypothetical protein
LVFVEAERHLRATDEDRAFDEVGLLHHQVDGVFLRLRQRTRLEDRAARADELQEAILVDVLLEERPVGRGLVDVAFLDVDLLLLQKTSGVAAGRSRGFEIEHGLGHARHCTSRTRYN